MPKVSVIVPVYNAEKFLPNCLDSILAQTYQNLEVILIDDGSTDSSGRICDEYARQDSRIVVVHQMNTGVGGARNAGLDRMSGDYVVLCDSDDYIHPSLVEHSLNTLLDHNLDCLIYGYKTVAAFSDVSEAEAEVPQKIELMTGTEALSKALLGTPFRMLAWNKLYKADLWETIRFVPGRKYGDDTSVTWRLLEACSCVGYTPECYYYYVQHPESALHTPVSEKNLQLFDAYDELISYIQSNKPDLLKLAYDAYNVRIFDFLARVKSNRFILKELRPYIRKHLKGLLGAPKATTFQKMMLFSLSISENVYFGLVSVKCLLRKQVD